MTYLYLFMEFFKTGLFAVGGGLATLPFLYALCDKYIWFTKAELADMIAISESTPGPIGVNMATYAGFQAGGIIGGLIATMALILPSLIIIIIISAFLKKFKENKLVEYAFSGIRPAVAGLISVAAVEIIKVALLNTEAYFITKKITDLIDIKSVILFAIIFFLNKRFKLHPIIYILGGAVAGVVLL